MREWWAHVTVTPEDSKVIVFKRGTWIGLKADTPEGGQVSPNPTIGARLL